MQPIYERFMRPTLILGGLGVYVFFTWNLIQMGYVPASESAFMQLTIIWVSGFYCSRFGSQSGHTWTTTQWFCVVRYGATWAL